MADRVSSASFIGRERELAELEAAFADARAGKPTLAFICGESGVGKSRLLTEFEHRAGATGARSLGGECIELGAHELPYAPLVGAIRPLAQGADPVLERLPEQARCELARLVPELGEPPADRGDLDGEAQRQLFAALLVLFSALAEDGPVVFWLEDLHWADGSTRHFLSFLARSLREEPILLALTYRTDELHRRHPVRPLLAELERSPAAKRIEIPRFDRDELRAQLADILGGAPGDDVVERLFARSEGNPLFTEELLAAGLDGRGGLPPTLRDALLLRCERLSPQAQEVLRLVGVAGSADDDVLARAGGMEVADVRAGLREAVAANVLVGGDAGRFSFRHALLREVVYDDLLPGERTDMHLALARALEQNDDPSVTAAVAHHYHEAGQQPEALAAAIAAASEAERVRAYGEAAGLLDRALALWHRVSEPEALAGMDRPELILRAAQAHYMALEDDREMALLAEAARELDPEREPRRLAAVLRKLADAEWSAGQAERGRQTLERALALLPDEPTPERAHLLATRVRFRLTQGRYREVEEVAEEALADANALDLPAVRARVLHRLGTALYHRGEYERADAIVEEALTTAREHGTGDDLGAAYANLSEALEYAGRGRDALALVKRGLDEVPAAARARRWLMVGQSEIVFNHGDWTQAESLISPDMGRIEGGITLAFVDLRRAEMALGRGDLTTAREALDEGDSLIRDAVEPQFLALATALRSQLDEREGRLDDARRTIDDGLDRLQFCTEDLARLALVAACGVTVAASSAQAACDLGDQAGLAEALERARSMLARVEAAVEDAPHPIELARLETAKADMARAEDDPEAAELWHASAERWEAVDRPYPAALSRWREAEARMAAGDRDGAAAAAGAALAFARQLGARWLVAELEGFGARARLTLDDTGLAPAAEPRIEEAERPFGLTERELQVLGLLATGATNREIGEQLFMAEKTASVHVSRILTKLDVRSRTEAAAVAHRQGLFAEDAG
jgi:ATP/maltotriose-dependent transcriptional regulator MalT